MVPPSFTRESPEAGSGKEVLSPAPPPLRTGRAPFNASGSSIEQRLCVARPGAVPPAHDTPYETRSPHWPWGQPGRYYGRAGYRRSAGAAPRALPPASDLLCPPSRLAVGSHPPTPGGSQLAFARGDLATPIRPVTGRPSLPPSSFTRRPVGSPCGWPTLAGGRRAYHVASQESSWVRPRLDAGGTSSAPDEFAASGPGATHAILVQAYQHLWLVPYITTLAASSAPGLAIPRAPGPRPPRCWQSRSRLALRSPPSRVRIRCPEGFAPRRCRRRTPR